jgi:hypothetical protein
VSSDLPVEPGIEAAPVQGAAPQGVFPVLAKDGCAAGSRRFPLEAVMDWDGNEDDNEIRERFSADFSDRSSPDAQSATRRAIVLAAAEIGSKP